MVCDGSLFIIDIRSTDVRALHFNVDTLATGSDALVVLRFVIAVKLDCQLTILVFMICILIINWRIMKQI